MPTATRCCWPRPTRGGGLRPGVRFEIAYIVESGLARMFGENPENIYFYITIYNEPYVQPAEPENFDPAGLLRGIYRYRAASQKRSNTAQILASGWRCRGAARGRPAGRALGRGRRRLVGDQLGRTQPGRHRGREGDPAAPGPPGPGAVRHRGARQDGGPGGRGERLDAGVPEQIRPWVPNTYVTLGTDGFGFSDTRPAARRYFNTDAESVVVAVLEALARDGEIDPRWPSRRPGSTGSTT